MLLPLPLPLPPLLLTPGCSEYLGTFGGEGLTSLSSPAVFVPAFDIVSLVQPHCPTSSNKSIHAWILARVYL
eukprot:1249353-Prorocentrum_lima.AAC.1